MKHDKINDVLRRTEIEIASALGNGPRKDSGSKGSGLKVIAVLQV